MGLRVELTNFHAKQVPFHADSSGFHAIRSVSRRLGRFLRHMVAVSRRSDVPSSRPDFCGGPVGRFPAELTDFHAKQVPFHADSNGFRAKPARFHAIRSVSRRLGRFLRHMVAVSRRSDVPSSRPDFCGGPVGRFPAELTDFHAKQVPFHADSNGFRAKPARFHAIRSVSRRSGRFSRHMAAVSRRLDVASNRPDFAAVQSAGFAPKKEKPKQ